MQSIHWLILIIVIILVLVCFLAYFNSKNTKSDKKLVFTNLTDRPAPLKITNSKNGVVIWEGVIAPQERRIMGDPEQAVNINYGNPSNPSLSLTHLNFVLVDQSAEFTLHKQHSSNQLLGDIDSTKTTVTFTFDRLPNVQCDANCSIILSKPDFNNPKNDIYFYNGTAIIIDNKVTLNNISFESNFCINTNFRAQLSNGESVSLQGNFSLSNPAPDVATYDLVLDNFTNNVYQYVFKQSNQC